MKCYQLWLPYYKQGDDMANALDRADGLTAEALDFHIETLESAIDMLRRLQPFADEIGIETADTHTIIISGPEDKLQTLVDEDILEVCDFEDESELPEVE